MGETMSSHAHTERKSVILSICAQNESHRRPFFCIFFKKAPHWRWWLCCIFQPWAAYYNHTALGHLQPFMVLSGGRGNQIRNPIQYCAVMQQNARLCIIRHHDAPHCSVVFTWPYTKGILLIYPPTSYLSIWYVIRELLVKVVCLCWTFFTESICL